MKNAVAALAVLCGTLLLAGGPAHAVIFGGDREAPLIFELNPKLNTTDIFIFDQFGQPTNTSVTGGISGTITLGPRTGPSDPRRPEGDVGRDGFADIFFEDLLDFEFRINLPLDTDGNVATLTVLPDVGAFDIITGEFRTDGRSLTVNASGLLPGTPLLQITRDIFPTPLSFPNGQRYDGADGDLLLLQFLAGSINVLTAALPDGIAGGAAAIGFGQITPDDTFVLASVATATAVPAPGGLLLFGAGVVACAASRRRAA